MSVTHIVQRIAVLVSVGRHPVSGTPCYSRNDAAALAIGQRLAERHAAQIEVLHAGEASHPALSDYLALGARTVEVLVCSAHDDVAAALAARLRGCDLVLTGTRAEGAYNSGMLPYRVAAALDYACVNAALDVKVAADCVAVRQFLPKGVRRCIEATLPAVVAVHPLADVQPRYAYARQQLGRVRPVLAATSRCAEALQWTTGPALRQPVKLAAAEKRSGHQRMLGAMMTESRGGSVIDSGDAAQRARAILAYMHEHRLIED